MSRLTLNPGSSLPDLSRCSGCDEETLSDHREPSDG